MTRSTFFLFSFVAIKGHPPKHVVNGVLKARAPLGKD
jgi:hypothetical protein